MSVDDLLVDKESLQALDIDGHVVIFGARDRVQKRNTCEVTILIEEVSADDFPFKVKPVKLVKHSFKLVPVGGGGNTWHFIEHVQDFLLLLRIATCHFTGFLIPSVTDHGLKVGAVVDFKLRSDHFVESGVICDRVAPEERHIEIFVDGTIIASIELTDVILNLLCELDIRLDVVCDLSIERLLDANTVAKEVPLVGDSSFLLLHEAF